MKKQLLRKALAAKKRLPMKKKTLTNNRLREPVTREHKRPLRMMAASRSTSKKPTMIKIKNKTIMNRLIAKPQAPQFNRLFSQGGCAPYSERYYDEISEI